MIIIADQEKIMEVTDRVMNWIDGHFRYSKKSSLENTMGLYMMVEYLLNQEGYTAFT